MARVVALDASALCLSGPGFRIVMGLELGSG